MPTRVVITRVPVRPRPLPSGLVHHSAKIITSIRMTIRASQVLRRPSLSMEAPRKGAVAMIARLE
jgi:hypothetical protein